MRSPMVPKYLALKRLWEMLRSAMMRMAPKIKTTPKMSDMEISQTRSSIPLLSPGMIKSKSTCARNMRGKYLKAFMFVNSFKLFDHIIHGPENADKESEDRECRKFGPPECVEIFSAQCA